MTYVYKCNQCNSEEEITHGLQMIDWKFDCTKCGHTMKRVIQSTPFHLKGSCWSRDNYDHPSDFLNRC